MLNWLQIQWLNLTAVYTDDSNLINDYWNTLNSYYTSKNRHYHNFSHIHNMLRQAESIKSLIIDYDALRFSIWYHDIIYKATKKDNELKSAEFAKKHLKRLSLEEKRVKNVCELIKSTQNHDIVITKTNDNAFLLDIDLSILGSDWTDYENYVRLIRKEYAIYPDFMYNKGRKKAMLHFLERERIFYSELYFNKYEQLARRNIEKELNYLLK